MSDNDSVKNITMSIIKEFNKRLLGESIDFLMIKREDLEWLFDHCYDEYYEEDIQYKLDKIKEEYKL